MPLLQTDAYEHPANHWQVVSQEPAQENFLFEAGLKILLLSYRTPINEIANIVID
jgi:hypothetical protein